MTVVTNPHTPHRNDAGFTLIEMMVSITLLMIVSGTVMRGVLDLTRVSDVVTNRTDMHNGVRNATELLTQEVGQAGRVGLPVPAALGAATVAGTNTLVVDAAAAAASMFVGEWLVVDAGQNLETVQVTAINGTTLTVARMSGTTQLPMAYDHATAAPIRVAGGFAAGVIPNTVANGSSGTRLKIFGDINGDGSMVYVEYVCDIDPATNVGRLFRNTMPFTQVGKPAPGVEEILIDNVQTNPPNPDNTVTPCFTYQNEVVNGTTFVIDVAITLTVRTMRNDPVTGAPQTETKALLNVSPRNVYNVWQMASLNIANRVQPTPASVLALLPNVYVVDQ
jgi:prepilin-type N-terminal cleavage/methylation domain-containing protein